MHILRKQNIPKNNNIRNLSIEPDFFGEVKLFFVYYKYF